MCETATTTTGSMLFLFLLRLSVRKKQRSAPMKKRNHKKPQQPPATSSVEAADGETKRPQAERRRLVHPTTVGRGGWCESLLRWFTLRRGGRTERREGAEGRKEGKKQATSEEPPKSPSHSHRPTTKVRRRGR
mmetsp:Transcript_2094/g.6209  ORF Transcript_2094/g.6209 Transcript_2094/m.6209 type:complete len:133 (-) Transcript_2094:971-1369(-)